MKIYHNNTCMKLPDFIIVGAAKSGTTALYSYLKQHNKIYFPELKEPWFFSFMGEDKQFKRPSRDGLVEVPGNGGHITNLYSYLSIFSSAADDHLIGEASTSYLYTHDKTVKNMQAVYGEQYKKVKIIIVLRDPVERAWSHYKMHLRDGSAIVSFNDSMNRERIKELLERECNIGYDYIGFGEYYSQVKTFLDHFESVKVILHEDLNNDSKKIVNEVTEYLGLEEQKINISARINASGVPKNAISKIISDFVYKPNKIKSYLKRLIPLTIRTRVRTWLGQYLFKENVIKAVDRENIVGIFEQDIHLLEELIEKDLKSWVTSKS
jgi:hypothetical protein